MKIEITMSKKEKRIALIIAVLIVFFIYWINKRYLYIIDAEFEDGKPKSVVLKTGFIFPRKTFIEMKDGFEKRIRLYLYTVKVKKNENVFDVYLNKKKITTIHPDEYYVKTHRLPTGRVYLD